MSGFIGEKFYQGKPRDFEGPPKTERKGPGRRLFAGGY